MRSNTVLTIARLLVDTTLFESRMSKLEGSGDVGQRILNVVRGREVERSMSSATSAAQSKSSSEATAPAPATNGTAEANLDVE